jgi:C2H2-type zinc finger protein
VGIYGSFSAKGGRMSEIDEQRGDGEIGKCHVCGREFPSQDDLSKHLMDEHDEDLLPDAVRET